MGKRSTIGDRTDIKMVDKDNNSSKLTKIFNDKAEIIDQYLLTSSNIAVMLINDQGTILDCNEFFLDSIQLSQKPLGESIENFVSHGLKQIDKDLSDGEFQPLKLTFSLHKSAHYSMSGHIIKIDNLQYIIFAYAFHLTNEESIVAMSKLTNELTDITREMNKKNRQLEIANETITKLMNTDPLTGLSNRRQLGEMLQYEMSKAIRYKRPLCILMVDIDHFKSVNDTYGHDVGDTVLIEVAKSLRVCRNEDRIARYGGEEFLVILPESETASALKCAERIRQSVEKTIYTGIDRHITISLGATLFLATDTEESFIKRADTALYEAKESGRNKVVLK